MSIKIHMWKIKEAQFTKKYLLEDDISKIFNYVFSLKAVNNTSYKFAFLKSIIECAYDVNREGEILLTDILARFTRIYWYLIVKHNLSQCTNATRVKLVLTIFLINTFYLIKS